jgi:hypothetical protein
MSAALGLGAAAAAALATNAGYLVQQRGLASAPPVSAARPLASVAALLRSPRWLAGAGLGYGGLALQTAALAVVPVSTVQAIIAAGVVVVAAGAGRVAHARERAAAALTVAALVLLAVAAPPVHHVTAGAAPGALAGWAALAEVAGLLLALRGRLGLAAGAFYGTTTLALAALVGAPDPAHAAEAIVIGATSVAGGFFAFQRGLQTGPPVAVVTLMLGATNVVAIAGGLLVMGDPLAAPGLPRALQLGGLALAVVAAGLVAGDLAGPVVAGEEVPGLVRSRQRDRRAGIGRVSARPGVRAAGDREVLDGGARAATAPRVAPHARDHGGATRGAPAAVARHPSA